MTDEKPKKKEEPEILVVNELPTQPIRKVEGDDGKEYELITRDEAIKEILSKVKELHKNIG